MPKASFPRVAASNLTHSSIAPADSDPLSPAKHFHLPLPLPNLKREMQQWQAQGLRTRQGMASPSLKNRDLLEHHLPECSISSDALVPLPLSRRFACFYSTCFRLLLHKISFPRIFLDPFKATLALSDSYGRATSTPPSSTHSPILNHTSFATYTVTSPNLKPKSAPPTPTTRPDQPSLHCHGLRRIPRSDGARSFPRVTDRYSPATILKRALP